jgi:hypothetical protein
MQAIELGLLGELRRLARLIARPQAVAFDKGCRARFLAHPWAILRLGGLCKVEGRGEAFEIPQFF